jgi:tight adherence protein B
MLEAMAALLASAAVFAAASAASRRRQARSVYVASRVAPFERHDARSAPAPAPHGLFRESPLAHSRSLRSLLARSAWASRRAILLERAELKLNVVEYTMAVIIAAGLAGAAAAYLSGLPPVGAGAAALVAAASEYWLRSKARRYRARFDRQLPVALQAMAMSLRSGFGIMEAVATVVREMDDPLAAEFRRVLDEARVGGSFESGLAHMVERVESDDLRIVSRALELHKKVGGNLAEILEVVAATMREREELRGHINALTAQQRLGGMIVGLLPLWVIGFFMVLNPEFIAPLWNTSAGHILLLLGGGLEAVGFIAIRRVLALEV